MPTVHSFDVFDTVLTRTVGDPLAVLRLLGERARDVLGDPDLDPHAFAATRLRVERELNAWSDSHVPLASIHAEMARRCGWSAQEAARLALAEQELERELVVAVPGAGDRLAELRRTGSRVVFVSDTPHSEDFVAELLDRCGVRDPDDRVFTSSARGVSKSRGGLFRLVRAELGIDDVVHHGDDVHADVARARWERWPARWQTAARPTRYERALVDADLELAGWGSVLAGVGRLARLRAVEAGTSPAVASVATGAMAPLLVGYVDWCLRRARELGLRRLYFVARDGEVMLRVARAMAPAHDSVELRYLWGSRQPWVLGASATHPELLESWILGRTDFTAATALGRLGIDPASFHAGTGFAAASPERRDTVMSRAEREQLAGLVQREPWAGTVIEVARAVSDRCVAYLRQEGLLDSAPYGVVDAGWSGRASAALDQLVREAGGTPGPHFYVGQLGRSEEAALRAGVRIEPWLFDRQAAPASLGELTSPNVLVEMFCAGTTGRTVDYRRREDGVVEPVLDRPHNDEALAWGITTAHDLAVEVAGGVAATRPDRSRHVDLTPVVRRVLTLFWEHPTAAEVTAWGTFPGEEEIWPPFMDLAQPVTTAGVLGRLRRGETMLRPNNTWRAGSVGVSRVPWSTLVAWRAWQKRHPRPVRTWVTRQGLRALRVWARRSPTR